MPQPPHPPGHAPADSGDRSASPPTDRVIAVLDLLSAHPDREFTLTEIIRYSGISKATCHAVVRRLADAHYLLHTPTGYSLGPALIAVGHSAERSFPAARAAQHHLVSLAEEFGVPCTAAVHDSKTITVVDAAGPRPPGDAFGSGLRIPLVPPYGAVQIAWSGEDEIRAWLDRAPRADEEFRNRLIGELETIRRRGYDVHRESTASMRLREALYGLMREDLSASQQEAVTLLYTELSHIDSLPERLDDRTRYSVNTISAPAFDADGRTSVVLSLLMAKPLRGAEIARAGKRLLAAAADITRSTGGRPAERDKESRPTRAPK
ncbi:IclR family transcriptional regulator [Embleya sp. NPDC050493]|uniref:IclR family transcriptional regulator n=1 Tax=Embleya sp. NPDC050493 TaxID=3363989 RepID=UPI0037B33AA8